MVMNEKRQQRHEDKRRGIKKSEQRKVTRKKKKKTNADMDARHNPRVQRDALQKLYEENIMDRTHIDNRIFDEFFDESMPVYKQVVLRLISFDLQRLESFEQYFTKRLKELRFKITETYPLPHRTIKLDNINNLNEKVIDVIELPEYSRIISFDTLSVVSFPILMMQLRTTIPEGVKFKVHYYDKELKWERYVDPLERPDIKLAYGELLRK